MSPEEEKIVLKVARRVRKRIISRFGESAGYCGLATWYIYEGLERLGFNPERLGLTSGLCKGFHHYFLILDHEFILDVTADQFNTFKNVADRGEPFSAINIISNTDSLWRFYRPNVTFKTDDFYNEVVDLYAEELGIR